LRIEEAADALAVSRTVIYGLVAAGEIAVVHIGRSVRVPTAALECYVARLMTDEAK
jgi:excisionase family DNA binding protein